MVSIAQSFTISGIEALKVAVEVDVKKGLPSFYTVGLPDQAVSESKNRVNSAIKNAGYDFPVKKITVNLAPADLKKEGSLFDFPIALAILEEMGIIKKGVLSKIACIGELSLDGSLRRVYGALPIALAMRKYPFKTLLLPKENSSEAAIEKDLDVIGISSLSQAVRYLNGHEKIEASQVKPEKFYSRYQIDFSEVKGHCFARRAFEVAAAGDHNLLLSGPPGAGKTMLAKRLVTILPPLSLEEAVEVSAIQSVVGSLDPGHPLCFKRPFRNPHSTSSDISIIGGGTNPRPGEVTLAHRGVLFLDEFPEFKRRVIETLRQPLEDGTVRISRAAESVRYPARFIFVAAMNPCPCGFRNSSSHECVCSYQQIRNYKSKISGPILDRIDICLEIPQISKKDLQSFAGSEPSAKIRARVIAAREIQTKRFLKYPGIISNSYMTPKLIKKFCLLKSGAEDILESAIDSYNMSARAYDKTLKLARTIADLAGQETIDEEHVAEAIQYRFSVFA